MRGRRDIRIVCLVLLAAASLVSSTRSALAATYVVTRSDDPAPNGCAPTDCSLREAIIAANTNAGSDTIHVPRRVDLSIAGSGENLAATGDLDIFDPVSIVGASRNVTVIDANGIDRVFEADGGGLGAVTFSNLTITGGNVAAGSGGGMLISDEIHITDVLITGNATTGDGGGIDSNADVFISDSAITNNVAGDGGGISSSDEVELYRSVISGNTASDNGGGVENDDNLRGFDNVIANNTAVDDGGGIYSDSEDTEEDNTLRRTTISDNNASGDGGGIFRAGGPLRLDNSTVSGNSTNLSGGGIENIATTTPYSLVHTTVANNRADADADASGDGGGIHNAPGATAALDRSLLANNADGPATTHPDCSGTVTTLGSNVVESLIGCAGITAGQSNDTNGDPALSGLSNNGGKTPTHEIAGGSIAKDRVPTAAEGCRGTTDQRGVPRPAGGGCDSGSYELQVCGSLPVTIVGTSGADMIEGTLGDDSILALGGNDTVQASSGFDTVCGGSGNDRLFGEDDSDFLSGQGGTDRCFGGSGADTFMGCERKKQEGV